MRRVSQILKAVAVTLVAAACLAFVYALYFSPAFPEGERYEIYTGTSSEEIVLSRSNLVKLAYPSSRGECAFYEGERAEEFLKSYAAEVRFTEEAGGVLHYYCYSPVLGGGVLLSGEWVNLHIACGGGRTAVGTPVIFGGA